MAKISDYDKFDYDYEKYWEGRGYEDIAEKIVLKRYLKKSKREIFS